MFYRRTIAPLALVLLVGCSDYYHCDPGQILEQEVCVPGPSSSDDGPSSANDGGQDLGPATTGNDGGNDDGGGCAAPNGGFGAACSSADQCACGLDYCMTYQQPSYCTRTNCVANPALCPAGWSCVDLSHYAAGLPAICVRP